MAARSGESAGEKGTWASMNSSFFHGKFRKYSARMGRHNYLLKVMQHDVPELPATEYLCNQLAKDLKLDVPNHCMILFQNKIETFISLNFMDAYPGCDLVHIYRYLDQPTHYDCEHLLKVIEKHVKRYDAVVRFINVCLFDALIGNHDRHGRNLGLIHGPTETLLAPFYDNPCYLALEIPELLSAYHKPRGAIATYATQEPVMKDYIKEWFRLGFQKEVENFIKRVHLPTLEKLIFSSFLSTPRKEAIVRLVQRRYKEMLLMPFNFQKIEGVQVVLELRSHNQIVGILTRGPHGFCFEYDKNYLASSTALSLGPEMPLTRRTYQSQTLFTPFLDRIPPRENPAFPEYCQATGISPDETDPLVLLSTIASRGPSSFLFKPIYSDSFEGSDLKRFR
ncbi:MAG: hypothetical protein FJZ63_07250, partial [Chlamydiae bacterium]|nr:hypothetical protein [Chlamydiota bacterium]